jgi:F-type H+-transporting ATPase subunit a
MSLGAVFNALEQFDVISAFGSKVGGFTGILLYLNLLVICSVLVMPDFRQVSSDSTMFFLYRVFEFVRNLIKANFRGDFGVYFYYISTLFLFVLLSNVLGLLPYSLTITSYFIITFFLSGTTVLGTFFIGLNRHLLGFFSFFVPAGAPFVLKPLLVVIELVSYISRLFSLSIRLFANMLAGHALLKILCGFVFLFLTAGSS